MAERALRLEPTVSSPNIVAGFGGNLVSSGIVGATIAGGGGTGASFSGLSYTNSVMANFGTIGGGLGNFVGGEDATVGGGTLNQALASLSTIAGGMRNATLAGYTKPIGGGRYNTNEAVDGTIAGENTQCDPTKCLYVDRWWRPGKSDSNECISLNNRWWIREYDCCGRD